MLAHLKVHLYLPVCICVHVCVVCGRGEVLVEAREGLEFPEVGVTDVCELLDVGAGS